MAQGKADLTFCEELDLFSDPPINYAILSSEICRVTPTRTTDHNAALQFNISSTSSSYIDVSSFLLHLKCKIVDENWRDIPLKIRVDGQGMVDNPALLIAPGPLFFQSLFRDVELKVNNSLVTHTETLYPYLIYIQNHLNYNVLGKNGSLSLSMFSREEEEIDKITFSADIVGDTDPGGAYLLKNLRKRYHMSKGSKLFTGVVDLCIPQFKQPKYFPAIDGELVVLCHWQSDHSFGLISDKNNASKYRIYIEETCVEFKRVKVDPNLQLAHNKLLQEGHLMKYAYTNPIICNFTHAPNTKNLSVINVYSGDRCPYRVTVCLVDTESFSGDIHMSPFKFNNFGLSSIRLKVNDQNKPFQDPIVCNYRDDHFDQAYTMLLNTTGSLFTNDDCGVTKQQFKESLNMYVFDLHPSFDDSHMIPEQTKIQCNIELHAPYGKELTSIYLLEVDGCFSLDGNLNYKQIY